MKKLKLISVVLFVAVNLLIKAQTTNAKVIAVVNKASWCGVCKANGERISNNLMPYTTKGLGIVMNDLTDKASIAKSKDELKKLTLYKQIYKTSRKGVGRMMQYCGIIHGKNKNMVSGIITFIDANTLKVLAETSIAITDAEMKTIIDKFLN
jgi:hypothetical protein